MMMGFPGGTMSEIQSNGASIYIRGLIVWLVIIIGETVHGIARTILLEPRVGDLRARQIAVFSGAVIILAVTCIFIRWIRATSKGQLLAVGALWLFLTIGFEIALGRLVMGASWERLLSDYNLAKGGLLPIGMLILFFAPLIAAKLRGLDFQSSASR